MTTTIETDLKEVLGDIQKELKEIRHDLNDLKLNQSRMEEKISGQINVLDEKLSGQINVLDEKVTGFGERLENQEFTNRGILIALILSLIAGAAKLFGLIPPT